MKKRTKTDKVPSAQEVLKYCAWCQAPIEKDDPVVTLPLIKRPEVDLSSCEGGTFPIPVQSTGKVHWAIVPTSDSDAAKAGQNLILVLCSDECGLEMSMALSADGLNSRS